MGRLSQEATGQLCRRLSFEKGLRLPASLTRDRESVPTQAEVEAYLIGLVERDPSVFLERYGSQLHQSELDQFNHLSDDYEVAFYLRRLRSSVASSSKPDTLVKNRRLAHMINLMDEGEYFGDESMRSRDPLLFQQYIGKFGAPAESKPRTLSESILQNADEQEIQSRLTAAEEREQDCEEEEESEDETPETAAEETGPVEDEQFMRTEFETLMKERFLAGKDTDYVDYSVIDNDVLLDDDLLEIENRDKEDQYFDSDE